MQKKKLEPLPGRTPETQSPEVPELAKTGAFEPIRTQEYEPPRPNSGAEKEAVKTGNFEMHRTQEYELQRLPGEKDSALSKGASKRMALRKRKLAEEAELLSQELLANSSSNRQTLHEISDRVVEMEHHIIGSNEAANHSLQAITQGHNVAISFQQKARSAGQVLTTMSLLTHSIQGDLLISRQIIERLMNVSSWAVKHMEHLAKEGEIIAEAAQKIHEYADEINVLAFNMTLESNRIGEEAAVITVIARRFHHISKQAEVAATRIQGLQNKLKVAIAKTATFVASLQQTTHEQNTEFSRLATEVLAFSEKMRGLQEKNNHVQQLADLTEGLLEQFSLGIQKIRGGSEEMASSIAEISAGVYEQMSAMAEINQRSAQLQVFSEELKQGLNDSTERIAKRMSELRHGIHQTQTTIHQTVDAIHQITASASGQQSHSLAAQGQLQEITQTSQQTQTSLLELQGSVQLLTTGLRDAEQTINEILHGIDGYEKQGDEILSHAEKQREELDEIEQALGLLQEYSSAMATTGFCGEIEAARLGQRGEMFSNISHEISEFGERSSEVTRTAMYSATRAKERIDLIKRSIFDVGEIVRTTKAQRKQAESNLHKVSKENTQLFESTNDAVASMEQTRLSFDQIETRMTKLFEAAQLVVTQSSKTMEFIRKQVEEFDDLAETIAAFTEQIDEA